MFGSVQSSEAAWRLPIDYNSKSRPRYLTGPLVYVPIPPMRERVLFDETSIKTPQFSPGLLVLLILCCAWQADATVARIRSDVEMIVSSRAIVRARVLSLACGFDSRQSIVYTYVRLRVKEVIKGAIGSEEIVLKEPGGEVGSHGSTFFGCPSFTAGEDVVTYLDTWPDGTLRVHDMFLGKFTIIRDEQSGQLIVVRDLPEPLVTIVSPTAGSVEPADAGEATSRMELWSYLKMVRRKLAANFEESKQFQDTYYHGAAMLTEAADYRESSSRGEIQPQFHLKNPPACWFEPDTGQPVTFLVNPAGAPNPQIADDVNAAMRAWSTVPGCSLQVVNGGTTSSCPGPTGPSVIDFSNCEGLFSPGSGCQFFSFSGLNYDTTLTKVVNLTSYFRILSAYVAINPQSTCVPSDRCNIQELLTASIGLTLGPSYSWAPTYTGTPTPDERDATLFFTVHFDGRCASLKADDMNAIRSIYPVGGGATGLIPSMSNDRLPTGTFGFPYSASITTTGGTPPYTWGFAAGSGGLPAGLGLSAQTGTISGTPVTTGDYNFLIKVTDSNSASSEHGFVLTVNNAPQLSIVTPAMQTAIIGTPFTLQLSVTGGLPPYEWTVPLGNLPPGLSFDLVSGTIMGTPSGEGTFNSSLRVGDHSGQHADLSLQIRVFRPQAVPLIDRVKYKPGAQKLIISGQNFDPAAQVLIDGGAVTIRAKSPVQLLVKPLALQTGTHTVTVTNPNGAPPSTATVVVD